MNKKITIGSMFAVLMLVAISFATAINTTDVGNKESPLYGLRTRLAIGEKISNIIENIKTKFLGDRVFFIPFSSVYRNDIPLPGGLFYTKLICECEYTNVFSYGTCQPTCGLSQLESVCGGDCTYYNCHTIETDTCRIFCLNK